MRRTVHTAVQDRPHSLTLKRVSLCHSSCAGPCARFGNNQRVSDNHWRQPSKPMLVDPRTNTAPRRSNDTRIQSSPNRTTAVRTTRAYRRTTLFNSRAHNFAQLPEQRPEMSTQLQQELRHHGCTQCIAIARANATTVQSFCSKTCMNGGVVEPHLIENTNSSQYPRAGNKQTTGRQRVGIPLKSRLQNRQTAQPTSGASAQVPFVPRD